MTLLKFSWLAPEALGRELDPPHSAVVVVHPQFEQKHPQQDERMDQVIGLLGGKKAVEKLEATAGMEKEDRWALRQVEHREEGKTLPLLPPPRSLQAGEMKPPRPLVSSSGGVQEESQSSPLQLRQQQQQQMKWKPSPAFSFSFLARGLQLA